MWVLPPSQVGNCDIFFMSCDSSGTYKPVLVTLGPKVHIKNQVQTALILSDRSFSSTQPNPTCTTPNRTKIFSPQHTTSHTSRSSLIPLSKGLISPYDLVSFCMAPGPSIFPMFEGIFLLFSSLFVCFFK